MRRDLAVSAVLACAIAGSSSGQTLTGLRIDGPSEVVENTVTLYGAIAEFDNGWEFDVTLDSFLWVEPGVHGDIGVFGDFEAFEVDEDVVETISVVYAFGAEVAESSITVTILDELLFPLVVERVRPCGYFVLTPLAPYPNDLADAIRSFDRSGRPVGVLLDGLIHASRAAPSFDFQGNLVLGQWFQNTLLVISPTGDVVRTINEGGLNGPSGTAIDPDGNIAVGSYLSDSVKFYDPEGNYLGNLDHSGTEDVHCLAYDRAGNLYIGSRNNGNGRVAVFDPELSFVQYIGEGILVPHPLDMAFDMSENLWVTMPGAIRKFSRNGTLLDTITHPDLDPSGLALDEQEDLFVTSWASHEVFVFSPDGELLDRLTIDLGPSPDPLRALSGIAFVTGPDADCNGNEVADSCDIENGTSDDCNENGIPDECELWPCDSALESDGVDDIVLVPGSESLAYPGSGGWTIEAWLYPHNVYPSLGVPVAGQLSMGMPARDPYVIGIEDGFVHFRIDNAYGDSQIIEAPVLAEAWTHIAGVYDPGRGIGSLYVNGVEAAREPLSIFMESSSAYTVLFGGQGDGPRQYDGLIDEVRIWRLARDHCEVRGYIHRRLMGNEPDLVGYWRLDEGDGQTVRDDSPYANHGVLGSTDSLEENDPLWVSPGADLSLGPFEPVGWTTPEYVPEVSSGEEWNVAISADGLEMYIGSERDGFAESEIYRSVRKSINELFYTPVPVWELSIPGYRNHEGVCDLSADGLRIYTNRHYWHDPRDLYVATRESLASPWGTPVPIDSLNTDGSNTDLTLAADGLSAVFRSDRSGPDRLWTASRNSPSDPWEPIALIDCLAEFTVWHGDLSADGLVLFVTAEGPTGLGAQDIWKLTRPSTMAPFGEAVQVPELSSSSVDRDIDLTGDGRTAYIVSERPLGGMSTRYQSGSIFVSRLAIPGGPVEGELDCDGDIDVDDFAEFAQCLAGPAGGEPTLACDPADLNSDGVVDLVDVAVLQRLFTGP